MLWHPAAALKLKRGLHTRAEESEVSAILLSCIKNRCLLQGKLGHDYIIKNSLEQNFVLQNLLLDLYSNCGALHEACTLFAWSHPPRSCGSWNSLLRAHARYGSFSEAIQFFGMMCSEGATADKLALVSLLSSFTNQGARAEGKLVHSYVTEGVLFKDVIVGTALINIYGKSGSLVDAQCIFDILENRDTISWNAMISVCAQSEEQKICALKLVNQMRQEGIIADTATFVNAFTACSSEGNLPEGKQLHVIVNETGLDADLVVATAILNMYGKCSNSEDTRNMFDRIRKHDTVSWNTMIGAYAEDGQRSTAIQLFEQMQKEGVNPDKVSFLSILEAFSGEQDLAEAKNMHGHISRSGVELDVVLGTALINMYGRCRSPEDAWMVFEKMPERNAYTWNSVIAAYAQNAQGLQAIQQLRKMQEKGFKPDRFTLLSIVEACANELEIEEIHSCISSTCMGLDDVSGSALIYMYSKCGSVTMAWEVFNKHPQQSLVLWNSMIGALARNGEGIKAYELFGHMQLQGLLPDKTTYVGVLDAFKDPKTLSGAKKLHACAVVAEFEADITVGTALVNMYTRCSSLQDAWTLFENMNERDVISWTALITACCQLERFDEAFELFDRMQEERFRPDKVTFVSILSACTSPVTLPKGQHIHTLVVQCGQDSNVVVANALLSMYCRCGCLDDALTIFKCIQFCDSITYASILSACANEAVLPEGKQIHKLIMGTEFETDIIVGNALISLYGKCGSLADAQLVFGKMLRRDTITWTGMLAAYTQHGNGRVVLQLFCRMQAESVQPNDITFVSVLSACCHDGLVDEACHYFDCMKCVYGIFPIVDHYDCLVDLFARAGRLEEAENLIKRMPCPATAVSWTSLLSACKTAADVERAEWAAKHIFYLDPENSSPYLILQNVYDAAGRTDDSLDESNTI